jgi:predicted nucleic acid-binding protein
VVDSSAWIEYVTDGPNADFFAPAIEEPEQLIVPSITILEVFRWVLRERGESDALQTAALMSQGEVVDLDATLAMLSARLGLQHRLPLADSVVLATAHAFDATLWTQDADFDGVPGVQFRAKPTGRTT